MVNPRSKILLVTSLLLAVSLAGCATLEAATSTPGSETPQRTQAEAHAVAAASANTFIPTLAAWDPVVHRTQKETTATAAGVEANNITRDEAASVFLAALAELELAQHHLVSATLPDDLQPAQKDYLAYLITLRDRVTFQRNCAALATGCAHIASVLDGMAKGAFENADASLRTWIAGNPDAAFAPGISGSLLGARIDSDWLPAPAPSSGYRDPTPPPADPEVSSYLKVDGIYGARDNTGGSLASTIDNASLHISLQAGAAPLDLNQMVIRYSDGTNVREMNLSKTQTAAAIYASGYDTRFRIDELRDDDQSFTPTSPVMTAGDLIKVTLYKVALGPRTTVTVSLHPEAGAQIPADFVTPATFGTRQNIVLR